ncbi:MAG: hypothetical protein US68_C0002G0026 [Candidatus Shapirobacteria bacterium GW2011_GWE1_38_10]|uniref:Uncharacterized protein n=1 Tax=Candidatus Shapirobacteria bacterium GW2011_GWE1_38_10 TaxID=1618488 RepID=A0A0G0KNJ9_9BACT|nr:MAG: hypothetical protein US46_C0003G0018 [Candidatus Shapirobacteria bacterium GW2011_GWF2_37_20]KKQ50749.1 MAG: hypothetical protein US68_C0002G0026 [Candidatus Shapirobacteria bacterium GW2011_GWE1_38_10]KKQ64499.1 MAG: hypothetical protein US85_C0008G0028 [Candidatus Shapirobacteria bacterium GW2011_GWF1_38_23]HBP51250.1 hypothetical protein [Candidatus Shapirobacteria bacterium]
MNALGRSWLFILFSILICIFFEVKVVHANEKYATIVNPIRSRELWKDNTLNPLDSQYGVINKLALKATWLVQDDVLDDQELLSKIKEFNPNQELGLFLEVSPNLAKKARIYYPTETYWSSPKAVFLSAYEISERKKIIDKIVNNFQSTFGYLPKSAGAWWIDSWSQQYLEKKYYINTFLIVADQKTTDKYGVWGQWWGYSYHPSPDNILVPGDSKTVVVQWAQRDLEKAYQGSGPKFSNFSLQANDYISQGLNFNYFKGLANQYLSVEKLGQITIGLETGMESVDYEKEYEKQLNWIVDTQVESLKLSEFGDKYREIYENQNPQNIVLGNWIFTPQYRENLSLQEKTTYRQNISFSDKFVADKSDFLDRSLLSINERIETKYIPIFLLLIPILCWWSRSIIPILWIVLLYLPVFRSFYSSGWKVFFGPTFDNLILGQLLVLLVGGLLVVKISKKLKISNGAFMSVWIINLLVYLARYSVIESKYHIGFLVDSFRFIGLVYDGGIKLINQDLQGFVAATMLKFDPAWIWNKWWIWAIIYPVVEIGLVLLISKLVPKKLIYLMSVLSIFFIIYMFNQNPLILK